MTEKFGKHMDALMEVVQEALEKRDEIYFKMIDAHNEAVKALQNSNSEAIQLLSDKVFDMSSKFINFKGFINSTIERTDNAMAGPSTKARVR